MTDAKPGTPYWNPTARGWRCEPPPAVIEFHRSMPGYRPTDLVEIPPLATSLGVARLLVKVENGRFGLPAFKILGAGYAIARALSARLGVPDRALPLDELRRELAPPGHPGSVTVVTATDGNHGRAVARTARLLGLPAQIWFPAGITHAAKEAIAGEGAELVEVTGGYDEAVARAAAAVGQQPNAMLVQDTSWPGYQQVPGWIVDGYGTLFAEADTQLAESGIDAPDLVVIPVGVGSLAQAAVRHYRSGSASPVLLAVEPAAAPAILASLRSGEPTSVPTSPTVMTGLNCGTPSADAWPVLRSGLDAAIAVTDALAVAAVHELAEHGVDAGPCGAATLAGVRALRSDPAGRLAIGPDATVLLVSTEGRAANPLQQP